MEKIRNFCKLHLAKMLFGFVILLCVGASIYGVVCLKSWQIAGVIALATILQATLGYYIQKLEKTASVPSHGFMVMWYAGFVIQALATMVCIMFIPSLRPLACYIPMVISFEAFVPLAGHLAIMMNRFESKTRQTA